MESESDFIVQVEASSLSTTWTDAPDLRWLERSTGDRQRKAISSSRPVFITSKPAPPEFDADRDSKNREACIPSVFLM